jgi:hypothetical protein
MVFDADGMAMLVAIAPAVKSAPKQQWPLKDIVLI